MHIKDLHLMVKAIRRNITVVALWLSIMARVCKVEQVD